MLAFSIDYYGIFFGATQSVELFCTYSAHVPWSVWFYYNEIFFPWTGRNVMENRQNVRWHFLMATDSKKAIQLWFLISVSLLHLSSPSWARTNNPSVNSRMLYHWAIEEYLRNLFLTIVTITQSFSKNKYFAENNYKKPPDFSDGLSDIPSKPHTLHIYHSISVNTTIQVKPSTD